MLTLGVALPGVAGVFAQTAAPAAPGRTGEASLEALLQRMTLEEKLGQLTQLRAGGLPPTGPEERGRFDDLLGEIRAGRVGSLLSPRGAAHANELQRVGVEESRLGIPLLIANDIIHGYRTIFPVPIGEAATWRPALVERNAAIAAAESRAEGTNWVFAPMIDVGRDPRWGRIVETSGEDPYLGAVMGAAKVRGFQGDDPGAPDRVLACAKHFVGYGFAEGGRDYGTVDLSLETLHEVALRPFRAAVDAGVASMMTSFNEINGVPASGNTYVMRDVLRGDWGWDGLVISDWESVEEMIAHGFAADAYDATRLGLIAGVDIDMASRIYFDQGGAIVRADEAMATLIDASVRRVLGAKRRAGLFENPYTDEALAARVLVNDAHRAHAREAARRSFVLLENGRRMPHGARGRAALPLSGAVGRVALIGPLADDARSALGTWAGFGRTEDVVTILAALGGEPGIRVEHAPGCAVHEATPGGIERVREAIAGAGCVVAVVGETSEMNGEGHSRAEITVPSAQMAMLEEARRVCDGSGAPLIVLVMAGRPLDLRWLSANADALMVIWHPGIEAGPAVADILFGRASPSGRLPMTFPRSVGQVPVHYAHKSTGRPYREGERYVNRYIDESNEALYPFGYGLGYTSFGYGAPRVSAAEVATDGTVTVSVVVTNTGDRSGGTVVQLYFRDPVASRTRPVRQLVAFEAVDLAPGESREVSWSIEAERFAFFAFDPSTGAGSWVVEPGEIVLFAGADSEAEGSVSLRLTGAARRVGAPTP